MELVVCPGCSEEVAQLGDVGACFDCETELARAEARNREKIDAFDMLETASRAKLGWSLSSITFNHMQGLFKATLKGQPPPAKGQKKRFTLTWESGYGSTREKAVIDAVKRTMDDAEAAEIPVDEEE